MFFPALKSKSHWVYDDPSGLPEPLTVSLPAPLRGQVEAAASNVGLTPAQWLSRVAAQSLRPTTLKAI